MYYRIHTAGIFRASFKLCIGYKLREEMEGDKQG
jgi:hypothetical protein